MFAKSRFYTLRPKFQGAKFEKLFRRYGSTSKDVDINPGVKKKEKQMSEVKDPHQAERRRKFWEEEKEFESKVDYSRLSEAEKLIHRTHAAAIERGHFTYDDPESGDRVFTRLRHFLKGSCCGSSCRHCIYDHVKVPEIKKKARKFNTAYWTYDDVEDINYLGEGMNRVKPKLKEKAATRKISVAAVSASQIMD